MQVDGEQVLIVNQFNNKNGYYEWWNVEADIRRMAKNFPNTYSVAIFACCREIYRPSKHCGLFGGTKDQAREHFKKVAAVEIETERAKETKKKEDALRKKNELEAQKFKQIQAREEEKAKLRCKQNYSIQID